MSLFNSLVQTALQSALGGSSDTVQTQTKNLVEGVVNLIQSENIGGVAGLVDKFKQSGLGETVTSWVGTSENKAISPDQVVEALGQEQVAELAKQAGIPEEKGASVLSSILPSIVDKFTPEGLMPDKSQLATIAKVVLGGVGVAIAAKAAASAFDRKDQTSTTVETSSAEAIPPQPDASTAAVPATESRTYQVVSGDSLSKIAKHFYGDANQWQRIFEANSHQLNDPNRIFPGQILNIP